MAARDGKRVDGVYHFDCEACGSEATARRSHARTCSAKCAAELRGKMSPSVETDLRFYMSREKLRRTLEALEAQPGAPVELVVGVRRGNRGADLGQLSVDQKEDGGLVFRLEAPVSPFDE